MKGFVPALLIGSSLIFLALLIEDSTGREIRGCQTSLNSNRKTSNTIFFWSDICFWMIFDDPWLQSQEEQETFVPSPMKQEKEESLLKEDEKIAENQEESYSCFPWLFNPGSLINWHLATLTRGLHVTRSIGPPEICVCSVENLRKHFWFNTC